MSLLASLSIKEEIATEENSIKSSLHSIQQKLIGEENKTRREHYIPEDSKGKLQVNFCGVLSVILKVNKEH